jgi:aspartate carbamoyltransferase
MTNPLSGKSLVTIDSLDKTGIELVAKQALKMRDLVRLQGAMDNLQGKLMTALFYEPSSRTFGSFVAAMQRLGGAFIPLQGVTYSSVSKGETLIDTVRTFASYSDIIVIRHPEVGSAKIAAEFAGIPVVNAGDGVGEHPTQALLDIFTIRDTFGKVDGLTVTMVGDLLNGRTVHSLVKVLAHYQNITVNLVSPELLALPKPLKENLSAKGVVVREYEKLDRTLPETDVFYVTRIQKERFTDLELYEKLKHYYVITKEIADKMKPAAIILHPFPRVGEISLDVDLNPRAAYISRQMPNGMYVRMAVLSLILNREAR